jgi:hypothetical protein
MNVSLQYSIDFMGAIYYDGRLQLNSYSVSLQMLTTNPQAMITNIAMERIKAFVMGELDSVIFIHRENEAQAELLQAVGANVCTLPDEPVDQIIGIMLYCKLNAITEGQLLITKLDISSSLGDEVWYQHDADDNLGPFANEGWWHLRSCQKDTLDLEHTPDNVVKVELTGWQEYGLEWPDDKKEKSEAKVVRPDFKKNEAR